MKKVWINSLFGRVKGLIISENKNKTSTIQLVGYPFGNYPTGRTMIVPNERIELRKEKEK